MNLASRAILKWNATKDLLFIGYTADARFEVIDDSSLVHNFVLPSEYVEESLSKMQQTNRFQHGRFDFAETMLSFCIIDDNIILAAVGGELILATEEGHIIQRIPKPLNYSKFYSGPKGYVLVVNRETMRIEFLLLSDIFTEFN